MQLQTLHEFEQEALKLVVTNVTAVFDIGFPIRLEKLMLLAPDSIHYEPEIFPGRTFHIPKHSIWLNEAGHCCDVFFYTTDGLLWRSEQENQRKSESGS